MSTYAYRFVGQEKLARRLSDFDLEQFFQLTATDIRAINEQFRTDHRAAAALRVPFLRAAGRPLDSFTVLPRNLLRYVGEAFNTSAPTIASLRSIYQRSQTRYKHQLWAKNHLRPRISMPRPKQNSWVSLHSTLQSQPIPMTSLRPAATGSMTAGS